jgi:hypothetical protein
MVKEQAVNLVRGIAVMSRNRDNLIRRLRWRWKWLAVVAVAGWLLAIPTIVAAVVALSR